MTKDLFIQAILKFTMGVVLVGILVFWPAGTLSFWNGWLFMGILFIPMFGATFTAIIGTILILPVDPVRAVIFIIISFVIQQLENNLIYPKVVGKSVGLSGIWTLTAVLIFGSMFGVMGMVIGLPVASIAYALLGETVNKKLAEKRKKKEIAIEE